MSGAAALRRRRDQAVELLGTTAPPRLIEVCDAVLDYAEALEADRGDDGLRQARINTDLMTELEDFREIVLGCERCGPLFDQATAER